jgi:hypothetical protein
MPTKTLREKAILPTVTTLDRNVENMRKEFK